MRVEESSRITSDGGLLLLRKMDERLGFSDPTAQHITDLWGKNTQFPFTDLVRQSIYRRLAGSGMVEQVFEWTMGRTADRRPR